MVFAKVFNIVFRQPSGALLPAPEKTVILLHLFFVFRLRFLLDVRPPEATWRIHSGLNKNPGKKTDSIIL